MRALGFLVLVLGVVFGIGLYRGWFTVSASTHDSDRPRIDVAMDKDKMKDDVADVKDKLTPASSERNVSGMVRRVEASAREVTVADADRREITIKVTDTTKIRIGDRSGAFEEIRTDDPVSIVYEHRDAENVARTISIARRS